MKEEKLLILKLLKGGKIDEEQALMLLEGLQPPAIVNPAPIPQPWDINPPWNPQGPFYFTNTCE